MPTSNQPQKPKKESEIKEKLKQFVQVSQKVDGTKLSTSCDYYICEFFVDFIKNPINKPDVLLLNMNISSLPAHVFKPLNHSNIICISETRLRTKSSLTTNINNHGYGFEKASTESSAGGSAGCSHNLGSYLNIYNAKELESTFVNIPIPNK